MILFYIFSALNLMAFILIAYDKYLAKNHKRRIPEKTLLIFALLGGTIGSGFGMFIFRHKTAKRSYLLQFWGIVVLQILAVWFYLNS